MCFGVMSDLIVNFNDMDTMTTCLLMNFCYYLALMRFAVYTSYRKDILYVIETMRKDWIYSSHEDRVVLKEKCLFAFRFTKCFMISVIVTVSIFACIPISEVRT